ncbi:MAG: hypothetical protein ACLFT4_10095 [Bacteroidales bacterium]
MKERYNDRAKERWKEKIIQWSFGGLPCEILRSRAFHRVIQLSFDCHSVAFPRA